MYVVYIKDYIHHLLNEYKISIFVYNSDQKVESNILFEREGVTYQCLVFKGNPLPITIRVTLFFFFFVKSPSG